MSPSTPAAATLSARGAGRTASRSTRSARRRRRLAGRAAGPRPLHPRRLGRPRRRRRSTIPDAEHKRSDFVDLRDFDFDSSGALIDDLARCYKYWIALTDCRRVPHRHAEARLARAGAQLLRHDQGVRRQPGQGQLLPGRRDRRRRLQRGPLPRRACGRTSTPRSTSARCGSPLDGVAKGLVHRQHLLRRLRPRARGAWARTATSATATSRSCDDHDHVFGTKMRFSQRRGVRPPGRRRRSRSSSSRSASRASTTAPSRRFAGPEQSERQWLPEWGGADRYLREAMFGPLHPRASGRAGLRPRRRATPTLPGFGPFGTARPALLRPGAPARTGGFGDDRRAAPRFPVLRHGRQYPRPISIFGRLVRDRRAPARSSPGRGSSTTRRRCV